MEIMNDTYQQQDITTNFQYSRPWLDRTLKNLGLNQVFTNASGNYLYYQPEDNTKAKVLDFIGGYGSLLLGHNHPELTDYAAELLRNQLPIHSQMSVKKQVGDLALALSDRIGQQTGKEYITTFVNSGAEAVEAAIKHARLAFANRKEAYLNRLHRQLHTISNYLVKHETNLVCEIDGRLIHGFEGLKTYYLEQAQSILNDTKLVLLAAEKAFHGKTTGALDLTYNPKFRQKFQHQTNANQPVRFFKKDPDELTRLVDELIVTLPIPVLSASGKIENQEVRLVTCLGIIIEPIQGEGGVQAISHSFLKLLREITRRKKIPLIFDEIQCGFFRTGGLLHSTSIGVEADYYLLGKALGGGLVKNAALVVEKSLYLDEFGLLHTSTYADDEFSAAVSLKALEISERKAKLMPKISQYLSVKLQLLKSQFPEVIKEVRGFGLMWGVEFYSMNFSSSYCFQMTSRTGYLSYIFCSYLLNQKQIRVAPTLSDPHTLRLQPSLLTTYEEVDQLCDALEDLSKIVYCRDFYKLIEHLLPQEEQELRTLEDFGRGTVPMNVTPGAYDNVGFVTHFINENGARAGDESIALLSDNTINQLLESVMELAVPIMTGAQTVQSATGKKVNVYFAGLLFTANMARDMMVRNAARPYEILCDKAVDMLQQEFDCKLIGLGQYSSVITKNGKTISNPHVAITTGNSFTVGIGVQAVMSEVSNDFVNSGGITLGILGAGGNISSTYLKSFLPYSSQILFKGSDSEAGRAKTQRFMRELVSYVFSLALDSTEGQSQLGTTLYETIVTTNLYQQVLEGKVKVNDNRLSDWLAEELGENMPFRLIDSLYDLQQCQVTVVATNSPEAFLFPEHFAPHSVVYDISVPLNCSPELINNDKCIKVILGGVVQLPMQEKLPMKGYPLGKGEAFACISETILLGLEESEGNFSYGNLLPSQVRQINSIGEQHGFAFKKPKIERIF